MSPSETTTAETRVEAVEERLRGKELHELCDAAEAAILDGGGFGWLTPPPRHIMEAYWKGLMLVPDRRLFLALLDGSVAGAVQLHTAPRNNEAQAMVGQVTGAFLAPWSRGHGLARQMVEAVEEKARELGLVALNLDVRETQERAIKLYRDLGYTEWGRNPRYALVGGRWVTGLYFTKDLPQG